MKRSLYLDTSVPSAYYHEDQPYKQAATRAFWARMTDYRAFVSLLTVRELRDTPDAERRRRLLELIQGLALLPVTGEVRALARSYVEEELIPAEETEDAVHLAVATMHEIDYLVSWNYEHLIRPEVKDLLPLVNAKRGFFRPLRLVTPEELARGGARH